MPFPRRPWKPIAHPFGSSISGVFRAALHLLHYASRRRLRKPAFRRPTPLASPSSRLRQISTDLAYLASPTRAPRLNRLHLAYITSPITTPLSSMCFFGRVQLHVQSTTYPFTWVSVQSKCMSWRVCDPYTMHLPFRCKMLVSTHLHVETSQLKLGRGTIQKIKYAFASFVAFFSCFH